MYTECSQKGYLCYTVYMKISEIKDKLASIFRANDIEYAAIFGSVARGEDRPDSDVDILVRLGKPMGMFAFMEFIEKIEQSLKRQVDLVTEKSLNRFVKPYILSDLKTIYEK